MKFKITKQKKNVFRGKNSDFEELRQNFMLFLKKIFS